MIVYIILFIVLLVLILSTLFNDKIEKFLHPIYPYINYPFCSYGVDGKLRCGGSGRWYGWRGWSRRYPYWVW